MSRLNFTKKEQAWLERFKKTMAAAPSSLNKKISSYTIGDNNITIYDKVKQDNYESLLDERETRDKYIMVDDAGSEIMWIKFPFAVESTAG